MPKIWIRGISKEDQWNGTCDIREKLGCFDSPASKLEKRSGTLVSSPTFATPFSREEDAACAEEESALFGRSDTLNEDVVGETDRLIPGSLAPRLEARLYKKIRGTHGGESLRSGFLYRRLVNFLSG